MAVNNKISNILGTRLPQWLIDQLVKRSNEIGKESRNNDNILFLSNKSAWVRLVSSINIDSPSDLNYFQNQVGPSIQKPEDLAKQFVLFGGTSKYLKENSYQQRAGLGKDGSYGILGTNEIQQFGYRPMPGIQSVTIDTQGTLGSLRAATISFKCWDKAQLDIIDALYFKLGFTMFLEWGQTFFYPNTGDNIRSTETYSIDPFRQNLTKEEIALQITKNILQSDGNYDAMLGMVTNFTFSYNQEGGYDCTLKIMGLGVLGDSIKINNPVTLPAILPEEILQLSNTLTELATAEERQKLRDRLDAEKKAAEEAAAAQPSLFRELNKKINNKDSEPDTNDLLKISQISGFPNSENPGASAVAPNYDYIINDSESLGWTLVAPRFGVKIPVEKTNEFVKTATIDIQKLIGKTTDYYLSLTNEEKLASDGVTSLNPTSPLFLYEKSVNQNVYLGGLIAGDVRDYLFKFFYTGKNNKKYPASIRIEYDIKNPAVGNLSGFALMASAGTGIKYISDNNIKEVYLRTIEAIKTDTVFTISKFEVVINDKDSNLFPEEILFQENNNTIKYDVAPQLNVVSEKKIFPVITLTKKINVTIQDNKLVKEASEEGVQENIKSGDVQIPVTVTLYITDTAVINNIVKGDGSLDYRLVQEAASSQNQQEGSVEEDQSQENTPTITQIRQALQYQSGLELTLRTIQVHSLNRALNKTKRSDINKLVFKLKMTEDEVAKGKFYEQIFSNGVFSTFIKSLINKNITESDSLFKQQSSYGFATEYMAGRASAEQMKPNKVDFEELLTAYVVPYEISQEIVSGINTNHPVYIPFGLLLMILNNICTIYDTKNGTQQTPLVYVDFNPNLNFFLSNTKHLTTNPFKILIPYEGSFNDYKTIFPENILNKDKTKILPLSDSTEYVSLFNKEKEDRLSQQLPKVKFDKTDNNIYRGRLMNILLNIDYLIEVIKDNSTKDGSNNIYLKPFLEQLLVDVNKYLGDFSLLRLAYNDGANTFHIVDDQVCPPSSGDVILQPTNTTEIPLVGKFGLAKNLDIKSEVSTQLANMLAISANANSANKATLSTNGDSFGFINTGYKDRYIPERRELTGSSDPSKGVLDTLKSAAAQFNQTVSDFYSTINPSDGNVPQATNYYIERMSRIKNNEYPTRASSMIPVSVNFTMDGISGFTMGQAFTISDKLLPYTYNNRIIQNVPGLGKDHINKVGFTIVGLTNTIENNQWNTTVKANMIFLKYATEFTGSVTQVAGITSEFKVNPLNLSLGVVPQLNSGNCEEPYVNTNLNKGWEGKKQAFQRTVIDPAVEGPKLKTKYGETLAKAILATIKIEQNFRGFNNNYGGFDITSGGWSFNDKLHNGYVVAKEGGTNLCKAFISFISFETFIEQIVESFKSKGFDKATTGELYGSIWLQKWNGYGIRDKYPGRSISEIDASAILQASNIWKQIVV